MNGIEHYQEAERLIREMHQLDATDPACTPLLQEAQVHATLAAAAAAVQYTLDGYTDTVCARDWRRMLQTPTNPLTKDMTYSDDPARYCSGGGNANRALPSP